MVESEEKELESSAKWVVRRVNSQYRIAILALYEVLKNMKIRFLRTTSKETVS